MASENKKRKRRFGDRKDAFLVRDADPMHVFMSYMIVNRADNEAVLNEILDITKVDEFLAKKNEGNPEFKYTLFHFTCAALAKTIQMRPWLNRFYANYKLYERYDITMSFTLKKKFVDASKEVLVRMTYDPESDVSPIDQFNAKVKQVATKARATDDSGSDAMDKIGVLAKIPGPILKIVAKVMHWLDRHGKMPKSACDADPYYTTAFVTNLGSINMHADYHHLANWGTNSLFAVINTKKFRPFFNDDGTYEMRDSLEVGLTIDERIADGVYFARSLKVLRHFFEHPEDLDKPASFIPEIDLTIRH